MTTADFLLVGTGIAAFSAAAAVRAHDIHARITLVGEERDSLYSRPGLAYLLNNEIPEAQLFGLTAGDLRRLRARRILGRVERIDRAMRLAFLQDGSALPYTRLLLATGALAARLELPGAGLPGVFKLDHLQDARALIRYARRGRSAVVIGGGITALEIAEGLLARGLSVHYLMRSTRYWSGVLDQDESQIIEQRLCAAGLQIHAHTQAVEILGKDRVRGVRLSSGEQIACDLVGAAIGIVPRKELAAAAGLHTGRGVLVDEWLQTSDPHIYAAGDVAQVYDPAAGGAFLDSLWGPARQQGIVAGHNMAVGDAPALRKAYRRPVPVNVTRLAGLPVTIIGAVGQGADQDLPGIARGDSETWRFPREAVPAQMRFDANRLRVMVGPHSLLGAVVLGDQAPTDALRRLIGEQADITPLREQLLAPGAPVSALLADFAAAWQGERR